MFKRLNSAIAAALILASMQFSVSAFAGTSVPSFSSTSTKSLTAQQCTDLRAQLDKYVIYIYQWLAAQSPSKQAYLKPLVDKTVADAKAYVNKLCPATFDPTTIYECKVLNNTFTSVVSLGLNSSSGLDNSGASAKTICMSQTACLGLVSVQYNVISADSTSQCTSTSVPSNYIHLTDAQVQSKLGL